MDLVLWLTLLVCDGADEVAKLLVLGPCVKVEVPEPMVCDVIDEVVVVKLMLLVVVCPPVTVPVDLDDSGFVLCPALVVSPVLVVYDGAVEVAVPLWSVVVEWLLIVWLLVSVREDPDGSEAVDCLLETPPVLVVDAELAEFVVCTALVVCDDWRTELERVALVITWLVPVACPEAVEVVCSEPVEVFWPPLEDLEDSTVLVGLAVLAKRLVVIDAVPVTCSELKGWVVLLYFVRLVAVVWTELGALALSLGLVEDWPVPVVCCDVVGSIVLLELAAVPVVCPLEEAVPLVLRVARLALEVCTEPVDRWVLLTLMGGRSVPVVCPGAVERTLPPVLVACPVPVVCSEAIEELLWLALVALSVPAEVTEERMAVVCCEAADVLICPLIAWFEGAEVVVWPIPGGA